MPAKASRRGNPAAAGICMKKAPEGRRQKQVSEYRPFYIYNGTGEQIVAKKK
jgi:hypothetical protein